MGRWVHPWRSVHRRGVVFVRGVGSCLQSTGCAGVGFHKLGVVFGNCGHKKARHLRSTENAQSVTSAEQDSIFGEQGNYTLLAVGVKPILHRNELVFALLAYGDIEGSR